MFILGGGGDQLCLRFIFTTNPSLWLLATPLYSNNLTPITPQTYGTEEVYYTNISRNLMLDILDNCFHMSPMITSR